MNITLIRSNKRKNSTTYNSAEYLISKLENVDKVYEFTLPEDMPHICCGCYACIKGDEEKCGGYKYLKPILDAFDDSSLIIFCSPVYVGHIPGQIKSFLDHFGYRWLVHRPDFKMLKKRAVIIASAGGGGLKATVKDIKDSMYYWGVARTYSVCQGIWGYFWDNMPDKFKNSLLKKLDKTARKINKTSEKVTMSLKVKMLYTMFSKLHLKRKMTNVDDEYWIKNYKTEG